MTCNYIINEKKGTVTCLLNVTNKLDKDTRRYRIYTGDMPEVVKATAYIRGEDKFDPEIGKRVALAKAEKEYLNNLLNTPEDGLVDSMNFYGKWLDEIDVLIHRIKKKRENIKTALQNLSEDELNISGIKVIHSEDTGVTIAIGAPCDFLGKNLPDELYENLNYELLTQCSYKEMVGIAKLNKDVDTYNKNIGTYVAVNKLYLQAYGAILGALKVRKREVANYAFKAQLDIMKVKARREAVLENLKTF